MKRVIPLLIITLLAIPVSVVFANSRNPVQFGLDGGDNDQYAVTVARLFDSNGFVSYYKSTGLHWVYPQVPPRAGTLVLNAAGTVSLLIEIYNFDGTIFYV